MVDANYIITHLRGAWLTMLGRREGLQFLDVSEDGFWKSLQAVIISLPALLLAWSTTAREIAVSSGLSVPAAVARLGVVEMAVWFLPLIALAYAARPLGFANRFVHFFVASNWATAIANYLVTPVYLLSLIAPHANNTIVLLSLALLAVIITLFVRLAHVTLEQRPAVTFAVILFMVVAALLTASGAERALGLVYPASVSG
jgi:hypothetical protein